VPLLWATKIEGDVPRCTRRPLLRSTASKLGRRAHAGEDGGGPGNTLQYGSATRGVAFEVLGGGGPGKYSLEWRAVGGARTARQAGGRGGPGASRPAV
jgi:hypothetical protein